MYVCKAFYQQFEWAVAEHWRCVSQYPVLVCQGDEDKVTPIAGAEILVKFLLQQCDDGMPYIPESPRLISSTKKEQYDGDGCKEKNNQNRNTLNCHSRVRLAVIEKAGHCLQEEKPAEIIAHMEEFFSTMCGLSLPLSITTGAIQRGNSVLSSG